MDCAKETTYMPLVGGLDARHSRGVGRAQDFELVLNLDGSIEEGFTRITGWSKYDPFPDRSINQDLHDQMAQSEEMVDFTFVNSLKADQQVDGFQAVLVTVPQRNDVEVDGFEVVIMSMDTLDDIQVDAFQVVIISMV